MLLFIFFFCSCINIDLTWRSSSYHDSHLITDAVEEILFVHPSSPDPEGIHVSIHSRLQQVPQAAGEAETLQSLIIHNKQTQRSGFNSTPVLWIQKSIQRYRFSLNMMLITDQYSPHQATLTCNNSRSSLSDWTHTAGETWSWKEWAGIQLEPLRKIGFPLIRK